MRIAFVWQYSMNTLKQKLPVFRWATQTHARISYPHRHIHTIVDDVDLLTFGMAEFVPVWLPSACRCFRTCAMCAYEYIIWYISISALMALRKQHTHASSDIFHFSLFPFPLPLSLPFGLRLHRFGIECRMHVTQCTWLHGRATGTEQWGYVPSLEYPPCLTGFCQRLPV